MKFHSEPQDKVMYHALSNFYPRVTPSRKFVSNLLTAFEKEFCSDRYVITETWTEKLEKWLPNKVGLLRDPVDVDWDNFRVVDEKLYTLALLRYS